MGGIFCAALIAASSRIVINEVMANPQGKNGAGYPEDRNEYVELYNGSAGTIDLAGWFFSDLDAEDVIGAWPDTLLGRRYPHVRTGVTTLAPGRFAVLLDPEYGTDTLGGPPWPYEFPDSTLILTVGNTTLGDGLATNDPVLVCSPDRAETTCFGTPFVATDSFPRDPGDGIAFERRTPGAADAPDAWLPSRARSGGTPGAANSTTWYFNLVLAGVECLPNPVVTDAPVEFRVRLRNDGYAAAPALCCSLWIDGDRDGRRTTGEVMAREEIAGFRAETLVAWSSRAPGSPGACPVRVTVRAGGEPDQSDNCDSTVLYVTRPGEYLAVTPNPVFAGETAAVELRYALPAADGRLRLELYDLAGRRRRVICDDRVNARAGAVRFDARDDRGVPLGLGVYLVRLRYEPTASGGSGFSCRTTLVVGGRRR